MTTRIFFSVLFLLPLGSIAHHNVAGRYDADATVEVEGVVTETIWRNPHVQITMRVTDDSGEEQIWDMATTALSNMRRWQIEPGFIEVGETVRVAGHPARRGTGMYISNVLTASGEEVLLDPNTGPLWSDRTIEMAESRRAVEGDTTAPELGIFRVWSHPQGFGMLILQDVNPELQRRGKLSLDRLGPSLRGRVRPRARQPDRLLPTQGHADHHGSAVPASICSRRREYPLASGGIRHHSHDPHGARRERRG